MGVRPCARCTGPLCIASLEYRHKLDLDSRHRNSGVIQNPAFDRDLMPLELRFETPFLRAVVQHQPNHTQCVDRTARSDTPQR